MSDAFSHAWLGGLFGDPEVAEILSPEADLKRLLQVEAAWTRALGKTAANTTPENKGQTPSVTESAAESIARHIESALLTPQDLGDGTGRDGVPVPQLVTRLREGLPAEQQSMVHRGLTSQDVIDTAFILSMQTLLEVFDQRLGKLETALAQLNTRCGGQTVMAYTRMQPAREISTDQLIRTWRQPLANNRQELARFRSVASVIQYGGAVGTREHSATASVFAELLGLNEPGHAWHSDRNLSASLASLLSNLTGALGKLGQDVALMAADKRLGLSEGGGSSSMPHKQNPVEAELLVSLARYNAVVAGGVHQALVHEHQRSGSAWMLEWLLLPGALQATGRSLNASLSVVDSIEGFVHVSNGSNRGSSASRH